ncbi:MAG: T9SS type A sorting domain-containing protein, partial [Aequorivita sp.]
YGTETIGVKDNVLAGFNYYPNPTTEFLHISAAKNIEAVAVYNLLGQKVMTNNIGATSSDLNLSGLAAGTYMMKVTVEGQTGTYKIVKN